MITTLLRKIKRKVLKKIKIPIYIKVSEDKLFDGKKAIIFGGSGGIGLAIADRLNSQGCDVIIVGKNEIKLKEIEKERSNYMYEVFDLTFFDQYEEFLNKIKEKYGFIDFLIVSSGIHISNPNFETITSQDFDNVTDIDLKSTYFLAQKFSLIFNSTKQKKILLISSSRGFEPARTPYGISKAGVNSLVKGLAKELIKKNIIVNCISPGVVATSLINYKTENGIGTEENSAERLVMPEEVASLASFLLSGEANMIIGENILISGGRGSFDIR